MYLGQSMPYARIDSDLSSTEGYGALVARHDLVRSILEFSSLVEGIHIFQANAPRREEEDSVVGIAELQAEFGTERIRTVPASHLLELTGVEDYIFLMHGVGLQQIGRARMAGIGPAYPVCTLMHSINAPNMLSSYVMALLLGEPYDSIVVTSEAGKIAMEKLGDSAETFLKTRFRIPVQCQFPITKIPLGVDTKFLGRKDQARSRELLRLPLDKRILLYVGRLSESEKADLEPLLDLMCSLRQEEFRAHLVLAGQDINGNYCRSLRAIANDRGIGRDLTIIKNFPRLLKPWIFSAADVFVSPSDNIQETFGIAIVEAMACGLPVIASDWSGYRDLVQAGETGFLIPTLWWKDTPPRASRLAPVSDAISVRHFLAQRTVVEPRHLREVVKTLLQDEQLRLRFGENGRRRAINSFSWPVVVKQLEALWNDQQSCFGDRRRRSEESTLPDYGEIFGSFVTESINSQVALKRTPKPIELTRDVPAGICWEEASERLRGWETHTLARKLDTRPGGDSRDTLAWLWKKGYLELADDLLSSDLETEDRTGREIGELEKTGR